MKHQTTIVTQCSLSGVGLHTGKSSNITFKPARENSGIIFKRIDLVGEPQVAATLDNISAVAVRGTAIGSGQEKIYTIEHIMAVLSALSIDNVIIEIDNNEPPVLDGSAHAIVNALQRAQTQELGAERQYISSPRKIIYECGETTLIAEPSDNFVIDCTVGYKHPFLRHQQACLEISEASFTKEIANARTFCFDYEIEALRAKGLAKGGNFDNAIVVAPNGIHNPDKNLRYPDEFVRHKMLDLIGDLYLLGKPLKARIIAIKPGHNHNVQFAKLIASKLM
jgi:UDP-3-O-[3-hydroxymyristoyl] N-acetylglucosamine deacetylase/3-hydroxyacyl-[acyl-carrier-protein] dehydratase